jgi:quercetin dioxygenase-like cupin family protein
MITAQINEPTLVEFSAAADPAIGPKLGLALSSIQGAATTIVASLEFDPGKRSGRHTHSVEEVVLVVEGEAEVTVGDERSRLSVGEMVLIPGLAPHEVANAGAGELRTVIFFPNAALVSVFDEPLAPVGSRVLVTPPPDEAPADPLAEAVGN